MDCKGYHCHVMGKEIESVSLELGRLVDYLPILVYFIDEVC